MDNMGMGAALASMTHGDNRYEGVLSLSALPTAPVVGDPPRLAERARMWRQRRAAGPALVARSALASASAAASTSAPASAQAPARRRSPEASQPCGALEGQSLVSCGC